MITVSGMDAAKHTEGRCVAALGAFDALHIGHMKIIKAAVEYAKKTGKKSLVQLFGTLPTQNGEARACVNTLPERLAVLEKCGVDIAVVEEFTEDFKRVGYKDFVRIFLKERYRADFVFVGYNYTFGYRAEGDTKKLYDECAKYGIGVSVSECVTHDGAVSSTRIRELIREGEVGAVSELMGRYFSVQGIVVHGRQLGRTIGFPTVNMNIPRDTVVPKSGVYKTEVRIGDASFSGITNVGGKPTVTPDEQNIETYILGYEGDLYGCEIELAFVRRLRDIRAFDSLDELKEQLERDKIDAAEEK